MSPGIPYSTADMTPDELEIFSTYSGSRHGSSFSIEAQVSNGNGDFAKTKQFYSEGDILSQDSLQRVCAKRMSLPPEDISAPTSKKKSAKNVLKSMLPKLFRGRAKEESRAIQHRGEIGPEFDSHFPIMELSEEPATKTKGKCTYFYYGGEDHINRSTPVCASSLSSADQTCDSQPECNWNSTGTALGYPEEHNMSCTNKYSSRESGLGSNFSVTNTTSIDNFHHHCVKNDNCVQRSESMRSRYHIPQSGLYHTQKLSQPHHIPSLHSYERVNSPSSSGYCESQSGCSSLYSLGSSVNYSVPLTGGFPCHCEHHTSSSKRNSITSAGGIVTNRSKTSTRSHSFNGKYTIHRETQ